MKNHYEVLNLDKNCTAKEIKDSFIKLSKKYHPDKNKGVDAHKKFVEVNEAYSVLGKTLSRVKYDETLSRSFTRSRVLDHRGTESTVENSPFVFYQYGKYKKTPNGSIPKFKAILFCCLLMSIGTGIRLMVIWKELKNRDKLNYEISLKLKEIREKRQRLGKEQMLIELMKNVGENCIENETRPEQ